MLQDIKLCFGYVQHFSVLFPDVLDFSEWNFVGYHESVERNVRRQTGLAFIGKHIEG